MPFGVDEAGRGPVFGSMFVAAVWAPEPAALPAATADSKDLSPDQRREIAASIRDSDVVDTAVVEVTPAEIDDPTEDINELTVRAHADAIAAVGQKRAPIAGVCDACDTDPARFERRVEAALSLNAAVEARHEAEATAPLVAAASVIAKEAREAHVRSLAKRHGDIGSGYPSDPTTRSYLESYVAECGDLPPFARTSWSTCETVLAEHSQTTLGEHE